MLRCFLAAALLLSAPRAQARPGAPRPTADTIYIQPLGRALARRELETITRALARFYGSRIVVLTRVGLPRDAFYRPRRRFRARKLLAFLEERKRDLPARGRVILGLTTAPISTTKGRIYDWGILGYGLIGGGACVLSSYYVRRSSRSARGRKGRSPAARWSGATKDTSRVRERLAKIAVHEVGHALGLSHCPSRGCLMEDAGGTVLTCDREYDLCPRCRRKLAELGVVIPASPRIPWRRPGRNAGPGAALLRRLERRWKGKPGQDVWNPRPRSATPPPKEKRLDSGPESRAQ
jgi:archaemetzincin